MSNCSIAISPHCDSPEHGVPSSTMKSLGPMAIRQKRPASALSNGSASSSYKRRCIDRREQDVELSGLSVATAITQRHGGPRKCPKAPKLDEARDLSDMSDAPDGMFWDVPASISMNPLRPSPEKKASNLAVCQHRAHQGDHLSTNMSGLHFNERHELTYSRGDHLHHQPAFVSPGLDTVLISRHQYHSYFDSQDSTLTPPAREKLIQRLPTSSSIPFQPASLKSFARRAPRLGSGPRFELTEDSKSP